MLKNLIPVLFLLVNSNLVVKVAYDSLCPDSHHFFIDNLNTIINSDMINYIQLDLIPGALDTYEEGNLSCYHGNEECIGNKLHACAINKFQRKEALDYILCFMENAYSFSNDVIRTSMNCSDKHDELQICVDNGESDKYMKAFMNKKKEFKKKITWSPWITVNGYRPPYDDIKYNFSNYLCNELKDRSISLCSEK